MHSFGLPIETATVAVVEVTIRRSKAPFTSYRRVGLLGPTKQASASARLGVAAEDNCLEPLITNADREKPMPPDDEPVTVSLALIDTFGRRDSGPGPPMAVSGLHPAGSRILACLTDGTSAHLELNGRQRGRSCTERSGAALRERNISPAEHQM
jgi:hypothetical protein